MHLSTTSIHLLVCFHWHLYLQLRPFAMVQTNYEVLFVRMTCAIKLFFKLPDNIPSCVSKGIVFIFCQECYFSLMVISFNFCFYNPLKQFFFYCANIWLEKFIVVTQTVVRSSIQNFGSSEVRIWWNLDHFIFSENSHSQIPLQLNSSCHYHDCELIKSLVVIFISIHPSQSHLHWLLSNYHYWSSRREVFIIEDGRNCSPNSSATHSSVRSEDCEIRA